MLALLNSIRPNAAETPDTGTFADGAFHMPSIEVHQTSSEGKRRSAHMRDYGCDRTIATSAIGFA